MLEEHNKKVEAELKGTEKLMLKVGVKEEPKPKDPDPIISKIEKIEQDINKAKVKDIQRMKEELKQKLRSLSENQEAIQKSSLIDGVDKIKKDKEYYMLSKEERRKLKAEFEAKRKETKKYVKKKQAEEKAWHKNIEEKLKAEEDKHSEQEKTKEQEKKKKEAEDMTTKKKDIVKRMKESKQKREEELKKQQDQEENHKPLEEYAHERLEEKYKKTVELPLLEEKKQLLAEKRNFLKPITKEELEEREKKLDEHLEEKEKERQKRLQEIRVQDVMTLKKLRPFKTLISEKIHERDLKVKEEGEKKVEERKQLKHKMDEYAGELKEKCPVVANEEKAKKFHELVEKLKHPVRQTKNVRSLYLPAVVNKRGSSSRTSDEGDDKSPSPKKKKNGNETQRISRSQRLDQYKSGEPSPISEKKAAVKSFDYLKNQRVLRENQEPKPEKQYWTLDVKDNDIKSPEGRGEIEKKARMIEQEAKKKEKEMEKHGGTTQNIEMGEHVSDMFLNAVKAKLALLNNM